MCVLLWSPRAWGSKAGVHDLEVPYLRCSISHLNTTHGFSTVRGCCGGVWGGVVGRCLGRLFGHVWEIVGRILKRLFDKFVQVVEHVSSCS